MRKGKYKDPKMYRAYLFGRLRIKDVLEVFEFEQTDVDCLLRCDCGYLSSLKELCSQCCNDGFYFALCNRCAILRGIDLKDLFLEQCIESRSW